MREIKEKFCYVSANIDDDRRLSRETTCLEKEYVLPDKSKIRVLFLNNLQKFYINFIIIVIKKIKKIGRERFEALELLFNPYLDGHEIVYF